MESHSHSVRKATPCANDDLCPDRETARNPSTLSDHGICSKSRIWNRKAGAISFETLTTNKITEPKKDRNSIPFKLTESWRHLYASSHTTYNSGGQRILRNESASGTLVWRLEIFPASRTITHYCTERARRTHGT